jgi:Leucine-rich repeat (LRR) protein
LDGCLLDLVRQIDSLSISETPSSFHIYPFRNVQEQDDSIRWSEPLLKIQQATSLLSKLGIPYPNEKKFVQFGERRLLSFFPTKITPRLNQLVPWANQQSIPTEQMLAPDKLQVLLQKIDCKNDQIARDQSVVTEDCFCGCGLHLVAIPSFAWGKKREICFQRNCIASVPKFPEIWKQLTSLDLSNNLLYDLPPSIENVINLQVLCLNHNRLRRLPITIVALKHLQKLYVAWNRLNDLPVNFGNLEDLVEFDVSNNVLTQFPLSMKRMSKLASFVFTGNPVGPLPEWIERFTNPAHYTKMPQLPDEETSASSSSTSSSSSSSSTLRCPSLLQNLDLSRSVISIRQMIFLIGRDPLRRLILNDSQILEIWRMNQQRYIFPISGLRELKIEITDSTNVDKLSDPIRYIKQNNVQVALENVPVSVHVLSRRE